MTVKDQSKIRDRRIKQNRAEVFNKGVKCLIKY